MGIEVGILALCTLVALVIYGAVAGFVRWVCDVSWELGRGHRCRATMHYVDARRSVGLNPYGGTSADELLPLRIQREAQEISQLWDRR